MDEVVKNPYNWQSQKIFLKEADQLLENLYKILDSQNLKYHKDKRSLQKATWMLLNDGLDTLRDCVFLMKIQKHRLVGKMFRHLIEVIDLTNYFQVDTTKSRNDLEKWFDDKIVTHKRYRDHIEKEKGEEMAVQRRSEHRIFSRWTHHTYTTLLNSYSLGKDDLLVYDSHSPNILVLPQTLSQYLWALGQFIGDFLVLLRTTGFASKEDLELANQFEIEKENHQFKGVIQ